MFSNILCSSKWQLVAVAAIILLASMESVTGAPPCKVMTGSLCSNVNRVGKRSITDAAMDGKRSIDELPMVQTRVRKTLKSFIKELRYVYV